MDQFIWIWLGLTSLLGGTLFVYDKYAARKHKTRIPEMVLHATELAGGVFLILFLMYFIRHKYMKDSYFLLNWLIAAVWLIVLYFGIKHQII